MVYHLPVIGVVKLAPLIVGTVAGMGIEKGFRKIFPESGGDIGVKKGGIGTTYHEPYSHYAPTTVDMRQVQLPDYQVAVDSPFARQDITKKQTQEPDITGATQRTGADLTMLALIGAGGLVLYGVLKK